MLKIHLFIIICAIWYIPTSFASNEKVEGRKLKFSLTADYSTGKYGFDESTDILYVPLEIKYRILPWQLNLTIPYIRIEGPVGVVGGGGGGIISTAGNSGSSDCKRKGYGQTHGNGTNTNSCKKKRVMEQGLGDILLETVFSLDLVHDLPFYTDVGAILKLPTADKDKGLGTGEFDLALQAEMSKIYHLEHQMKITPFFSIAYRFMGDPHDLDFNNVWHSSIGLDLKLRSPTHIGLSYDFRQAITSGSANVSEALFYFDRSLNKNWSLSAYGMLGFENGSPDQAIGLQLKFSQ